MNNRQKTDLEFVYNKINNTKTFKEHQCYEKVSKDLQNLIEHQRRNIENYKIGSIIRDSLNDTFKSKGAINVLTSAVTHGMNEYNFPLAQLKMESGKILGKWRSSPQFQKQLFTMITHKPYIQIAPSIRPGENDETHSTYLNQMDIEFPFETKDISLNDAEDYIIEIILEAIQRALELIGLNIGSTQFLTYDESMNLYGTCSPFIPSNNKDINIAVIKHPPLFLQNEKNIDTHILPMAMPILNDSQKDKFINLEMNLEDLTKIKVHGYDFIASSRDVMYLNNEGLKEGLEVAGGSLRINNPQIQSLILKIVRQNSYKTFLPLLNLLEKFDGSGIFTGGGAIGTERLTMISTGSSNIKDTITMPWEKGCAPFSYLI